MVILHQSKARKYSLGQIDLGSNIWLLFKRELSVDTDRECITVSLVDNTNESSVKLGSLIDGRWNFPSQHNANVFWKHAKAHSIKFEGIIRNLTVSLKDFQPFLMEWKCLKRRFRLESIKVGRKIKHQIL